jgi:predicted regulator of Ras-like GTPase activity (Roadblock/LC7/MglB family)
MKNHHSPQSVIEEKMREITERGNYDMVQLFSNEGLPIAEYCNTQLIEKDRLAELSILFREIRKMADVMGKISSIKEMVIEGYNQRKIVFRFFHAFGQDVILAAVIPPKKAYKGLTNSLVRIIEKIPV